MSHLVKIIVSPFVPQVEVAGDIAIALHQGSTDVSVSVLVAPNLQHYEENPEVDGVEAAQEMGVQHTADSTALTFDFDKNRRHKVSVEGRNYDIELMNIGMETIQNADWRCYELNVTENE